MNWGACNARQIAGVSTETSVVDQTDMQIVCKSSDAGCTRIVAIIWCYNAEKEASGHLEMVAHTG